MRAVILTLVLVGCGGGENKQPEAAPTAPPAPVAADAPTAPAPTATPAPAPDAAAPAPGPDGGPGNAPGLASLIKGGKSIAVSGTIKGATKAFVDFAEVKEVDGAKVPSLIQQVAVTDGTFKVDAPANFAGELYLIATVDADGNGPSPNDQMAVKALKLGAEPVTLELTPVDAAVATKGLPWSTGAGAAPPPPANTGAAPAAAPAGAPAPG